MSSESQAATQAEEAGSLGVLRDGLLSRLVAFAESGFGLPVGLLTGGTIVRGALGSSESFAKSVDRAAEPLLVEWTDGSPAKEFLSALGSRLLAIDERHLPTQGDGVTESEQSVDSPVEFVYINSAVVVTGGVETRVGAIRVRLDAIDAWWALESDSNANLSYRRGKRG